MPLKRSQSLVSIGLACLCLSCLSGESTTRAPLAVSTPTQTGLRYQSYTTAHSVAHTVIIPNDSNLIVTPALAEQLTSLTSFAQEDEVLAIINGGFFDPQNQKTTSFVLEQGEVVANPQDNERLVNNPQLTPYIDKILNRTEFRRYLCGESWRYDIALHSEPSPSGCRLIDALGAGPRLLPKLGAQEEGFVDYNANGQVIRDALGNERPNARSAVGITATGDVLLVMVAQKRNLPRDSGMSLPELATFLRSLEVEEAMNLDGGSSSALFYQGQVFFGKVDAEGNPIKRKVKSVLVVRERFNHNR